MALISHPGKLGDLLWALPTIRAIEGTPHDIQTSGYCSSLAVLLSQQSYINNVYEDYDWHVEFGAPVRPWAPPNPRSGYGKTYHLGMREWPSPTLAEYYPALLQAEYGIQARPDFSNPWLSVGNLPEREEICFSFTDEYVESKVGAIFHVKRVFPWLNFRLLARRGSRILTDFGLEKHLEVEVCDILGLARKLKSARVAVVDNSMSHPLGVGLGANLVVYEPQSMRHQKVFKAPSGCKVLYSDSVNSFELIDKLEQMGLSR